MQLKYDRWLEMTKPFIKYLHLSVDIKKLSFVLEA